jgi:DNA-binding CsgD family transcriptional regulator
MATGEGQRIVPVRLALAEAAWLAGDLPQCRAELAALQAIDTGGLNLWDQGQVAVWQRRAGLAVQATAAYPAPHAAELRGDAPAAAQVWLALGLPCEAALASMQEQPEAARAAGLALAVQLLEESQAWAAATCARAIAQRLGLAAHLPRLRRGPYSAAREHPLGLTQRELQVARFIGEGLNNADIAQRLSRSVRTVEHHVSAVLAKLDAGTRLDLIARLRREPGLLGAGALSDGD